MDFQGINGQYWIDTRSHFPVRVDYTINGVHAENHYSPLQLDFAHRSAECL